MKIINFINPTEDKEAYDVLIHCNACGFQYDQTKDTLKDFGYYLPEDQFKAMEVIINTQMSMDIGHRRAERGNYAI